MSSTANSLGFSSNDEAVLDSCLDFIGLSPLKRPIRRLSVHRLPSFDPSSTWTLLQDQNSWRVRRIVIANVQEGPSLVTNSYGSDGLLAEDAAFALLRELASINAMMFDTRASGIGIDGMRIRLTAWRSMQHAAVFKWRGAAPESWLPLRDFTRFAIETFEATLPASKQALQVQHPWVE